MKTNVERKTAILAVSFGTSHNDTREVTIDAIEEALKNACRMLLYIVHGPVK